ncbi:MAG: caspase family protein, partial [Planctomycetes bacterium]|nr:caspase family protein [Planctomycetota bacterium]
MARTLYALLVGIDKYAGPVRPLNGCVNDIQWFDQYLQNAGTTVKTVRLLNDQATRQAIIQGFREHLAQAGPDDGVLFVYCGHGSQAPAPPEFWDIEPDHKNETLVCHDSRTTAWDLADKEVAQLLAEVTATGAHVVVVLDCCHSGSGTRGETEARQIPGDDRPRPADTFLYTPAQAAAHMPAARDAAPGRLEWTGARYVLLAACASDQTAKEYCADGTQRGAFSYFLADTLQRASGPLSYYELFGRAAALVESHVLDQTPQLETHANDLLGGVFLSGVLKDPQQERRVYADQAGRWIVDAGAMHGIRLETPDNTTVLALFPFDLPSTGFADPTNRRGTATVTEVRPTQSSVTLKLADGSNPRPDEVYKAVVTQAPFERLPVALSGEEPGVQAARRALNLVGNGAPSLYVREARPGETPTLILTAGAGSYTIRRPADAQPLTAPLS